MGTYTGSPWGKIRGKVDDAVGGIWKGIDWVRLRIIPTQRGTIKKYRAYKDNPTYPFSFEQFNLRRLVFSVLGYIARSNSNIVDWIRPVWDGLVTKRGWTMTGTNAFIKRNAAVLFASMTTQGAEYDPSTNTIDIEEMLVSDGDLEEVASITSAVYTTGTGALVIIWDATTYTNGSTTDKACYIIAKKPLLQMEAEADMTLWNWRPNLYLYITIPSAETRVDATGTVTLPTGLTETDLTAYVFFLDDIGGIGYSPSKAKAVTAI